MKKIKKRRKFEFPTVPAITLMAVLLSLSSLVALAFAIYSAAANNSSSRGMSNGTAAAQHGDGSGGGGGGVVDGDLARVLQEMLEETDELSRNFSACVEESSSQLDELSAELEQLTSTLRENNRRYQEGWRDEHNSNDNNNNNDSNNNLTTTTFVARALYNRSNCRNLERDSVGNSPINATTVQIYLASTRSHDFREAGSRLVDVKCFVSHVPAANETVFFGTLHYSAEEGWACSCYLLAFKDTATTTTSLRDSAADFECSISATLCPTDIDLLL